MRGEMRNTRRATLGSAFLRHTRAFALLLLLMVCGPSQAAPPIKVLLCTGDYGMWAQDRAAMIEAAVGKARPGGAVFETEQSFNFVKKLEAPGYAERFDVIACGDVALGQMTTRMQAALVRFVDGGGGLIYVVQAKSGIAFTGAREVEPLPLAGILPYKYPATDPAQDATAPAAGDPLFAGLDFSHTPPLPAGGRLLLERKQGAGRVLALFGAFSASYKYVSYATYTREPGGWDEWPGLGEFWARLLERAASGSPVRGLTRAQTDARTPETPLAVQATVDATRETDDVRAADFSIVALQQLYNEDGGANEGLFLDLNPRDWFDRRSQEVLPNTAGKFPDKPALFRQYHITGILMGDNSYGSYSGWDEAKWKTETAKYVEAARKYPDILRFFQPGNEPPPDAGYFAFHNRIAQAVRQGAPNMQVMGPNTAFNIAGVDAQAMKAFLAACGPNTDVLNWHIYGRCPESVRDEAQYWSRYATGRLHTPGPARVLFTEADSWNTESSQFNYLMDRAFTFLPTKEIIACFQYCMEPRSEGGPYKFGVLQPEGEMSANYNGYWIWRGLRGRLVDVALPGLPPGARDHCRVLASRADGGRTVTVVAYYDTGYFDGPARARAAQAEFALRVKLPPGRYTLQRSDADWQTRRVQDVPGTAQGTAQAAATLAPCQAVAFTWTRLP